jgi:hypothetical protein
VFSTACFGQTHLNAWIDGGFRVASGSRGIYADSALSFPVFLGAWSAGVGFAQAVQAANAADPAHIQDGLAKNWYEGRGLSSFASQVNSVRVVRGNGGLNINSPR